MLTETITKFDHFFTDENDLKQGEYKGYYNSGVLYEHAFYLNDKLHGEYKRYHANGQLWEHAFYLNDKLHGEYKRYHANGHLYYSSFFYQGNDFHVNPDTLTKHDKTYILLSGRLPPRD